MLTMSSGNLIGHLRDVKYVKDMYYKVSIELNKVKKNRNKQQTKFNINSISINQV